MLNRNTQRVAAIVLVAIVSSVASGAAFTPDQLAILRVGDGTLPLAPGGNAVFLDERSLAGALIQSIALPTASSGTVRAALLNGTSIPEGQMTRSQDQRYLIISAYQRDVGAATSPLSSASALDVPRLVLRVSENGEADASTALTDAYSSVGFRGAASQDGSEFWLIGSNQGVRHAIFGAVVSTLISDTATNLRHINIVDSRIIITTAQSTAPFRVGAISTLANTGPQTITGLPGMPIDNSNLFANAFTLLDLSAAEPGADVVLVTEDLPNSNTSGLAKFSKVSGTWIFNGRIALAPTRAVTARAALIGKGIEIFTIVTGDTCTQWTSNVPTRLCSLIDAAGYNAAPSASAAIEIAAAPANQAFRGPSFTPRDDAFSNGFEGE